MMVSWKRAKATRRRLMKKKLVVREKLDGGGKVEGEKRGWERGSYSALGGRVPRISKEQLAFQPHDCASIR